MFQFNNLAAFTQTWAFIPQNKEYLKIIPSMFTHASIFHLLGNMYFLWILGDNVEDVLGAAKFLFIYFAAGIIGFIVSGLVGPFHVPHVGASGAIAGIMAAYVLLFPKARFLLRFFIFLVFPLYSWAYMLFWIGIQLLIALRGNSHVSWSAHLAGFAAGFILTSLLKDK